MPSFRIIQPDRLLAPYVRHYWILQDEACEAVSERTLPTGCIQWVFHRGKRLLSLKEDALQPASFVCGCVIDRCLKYGLMPVYDGRLLREVLKISVWSMWHAFISQVTTTLVYLIYLYWLSCHTEASLAVYLTAEYLFVILLALQSIVYLKRKHY